jgi:cellulose synthase/poly-beta-1,6-N-acetylglucosamine synthase-like glycosyltransferase
MRKFTAEKALSRVQSAVILTVIAVVALLGILSPLDTVRSLITVVTTLALVNLVFVLVMMMASANSKGDTNPTPLDWDTLPRVTVFSPMRHEGKVVKRHINRVSQLIWPRDRIEFLPLVREDDIATSSASEEERANATLNAFEAYGPLPEGFRVVEVPPTHYGSKPAQLEWGRQQMTGEFFIIFDAENIPDPNLLLEAYRKFLASEHKEKLAGVQAVPVVSNWQRGFFPRYQAAEYTAHYRHFDPGMIKLGLLTPLSGNSVLFRASAVKAVGGYDRHNKAEDADLSVMLARGGYSIDTIDVETTEEAPRSFDSWIKQRRRWMDGFAQTYFTHMREPIQLLKDLKPLNYMVFQLMFGVRPFLQLINPIVVALAVVYGSCLAIQPWVDNNTTENIILTLQEIYSPLAKAMGMVLMFVGSMTFFYSLLIACMRQRMWKSVPLMPLVVFYWSAQFVAQWWAMKDFLTGAGWHKTAHEDEEAAIKNAPAYAAYAASQPQTAYANEGSAD